MNTTPRLCLAAARLPIAAFALLIAFTFGSYAADPGAPQISKQPANVSAEAGRDVTFAVEAAGTAPLSYQWLKDGATIAGATSATLVLTNVGPADAGSYTVIVSNASGSVTSEAAVIHGLLCYHNGHTYQLTPIGMQWNAAENWAVARGGHLVAVNDQAEQDFLLRVFGTQNTFWIGLSDQAAEGSWNTWSTGEPVTYSNWAPYEPNNSPPIGENYAQMNDDPTRLTTDQGKWNDLDDGSNGHGGAALAIVEYAFIAAAPTITAQPLDCRASVGDTVSFVVAAAGTEPLAYEWRKDGTAISGATGSTLTLTNVQVVDIAAYDVVVSNAFGSATSTRGTLSGNGSVATITVQPQDVVVTAGQQATLTVAASGQDLSYQWCRNGCPIPGATAASYTIGSASRSDANYYDVIVYSGLAPTRSQAVRLSVAPTAYPTIIRPDPAWDIEPAWNGGIVGALATLPDGGFYIGGRFTRADGKPLTGLARFTAAGTLDPSFTPPTFDDEVSELAVQADGKLLVASPSQRVGGVLLNQHLVRLDPDGSLDRSFHVAFEDDVSALLIQPDGKILVASHRLSRLNPDGSEDQSFYPVEYTNGSIETLALQGDGKILIGGNFTRLRDVEVNRLARLNSNGVLDPTFGIGAGADNTVRTIAIQGDGSIVFGGEFTVFNGTAVGRIARVSSAGVVDSAFNSAIGFGANRNVGTIVPQGDQLLVGGNFDRFNDQPCTNWIRLNNSGAIDSSFAAPQVVGIVRVIAPTTGGRYLVAGHNGFARINSDLTVDDSLRNALMNSAYTVYSVVVLSDRKILVGGEATSIRGISVPERLQRFTASGMLDQTFNAGGAGANSTVRDATLLPDGRVVIAGQFTRYNDTDRNRIAIVNADGTLDGSFDPVAGGLNDQVYSVTLLPGGRLLATGEFSSANGVPMNRVAMFRLDGTLDPRFDPGAGADGSVFAAAVQADGRIILGGSFGSFGGTPRRGLVRIDAEGNIDPTFNAGGSGVGGTVSSLQFQANGQILIGGSFGNYNGAGCSNVVRINSDGTLDPGFVAPGTGGIYNLLVQEDGKVLVHGSFDGVNNASGTANLARLNANGTLDTTFVAGGFMRPPWPFSALVMDDDGRLLMGTGGSGFQVSQPCSATAITAQPSSWTGERGTNAIFVITATSALPLTYQWYFNGKPIADATGASLTLDNVQIANVGSYAVTVSGELGTVSSNTVTLSGSGQPPTITVPPADVVATRGQSPVLSVTASGSDLSYQWNRNGQPIVGGNGANHQVTNVSRADADYYDVVVYSGLVPAYTTPIRLDVAPTHFPGLLVNDPSNNLHTTRMWGEARTVVVAPDGKFYVGGDFVSIDGQPRRFVARFNASGSLDLAFASIALNRGVSAILPMPDGGVLLGGWFEGIAGENAIYGGLVRLNTDGTLNESFLLPGNNRGVETIVRQSDGRILVAGGFWSSDGRAINVARFQTDGSLDAAFSTQGFNNVVHCLAVQPDGRILVAGDFDRIGDVSRNRIARLNPDGSLDPSFDPGPGPNNRVQRIAVLPSGKIILVGRFTQCAGGAASRIVRLESNGVLDPTFASGSGADNDLADLLLLPDGRMLTCGHFRQYNGVQRSGVIRLNADGSLDSAFDSLCNGGNVYGIAQQADGRLILVGGFREIGGGTRQSIARLSAEAVLDPSFAPVAVFPGTVEAIVNAPDGKLLVAGDFITLGSAPANRIGRLNSDGAIDTSFDVGTGASGNLNAACRLADGGVVLFGGFNEFNGTPCRGAVRLNKDGRVDPLFAPADWLWSPTSGCVLALSRGRILLPTNQPDWAGTPVYGVLVLNPDGTRDASFDIGNGVGQGSNAIRAAAVQPDGKVLLGGNFTTFNGQSWNRLVRLLPSGAIDPTFHAGMESGWEVRALVVLPTGKIVVAGGFDRYDGLRCSGLVQLDSDGTVDASFTPPNVGNGVTQLLPQEDGRLIIGGGFDLIDNQPNTRRVARLNTDGSIDATFGAAGLHVSIDHLALSDAGDLYGATTDPSSDDGLVRFVAGASASIVIQPSSRQAGLGERVTFAVSAEGNPQPSYQWTFNGAPITGATTAEWVIPSAQPQHVGTYAVVVANAFGSITSVPVTLSGSGPEPVFISQPQNVRATAGQPVTLTVQASGTNLSYQWRRNGVPIAGATAASYTIPSASRSDADYYEVIVHAGLVSATSQPARLDVAPTRYPNLLVNDPAANLSMTRPWGEAYAVVTDNDGRFYVGGDFVAINGQPCVHLARFNADGSLDATFTPPRFNRRISAILPLPAGKVLVGGQFEEITGVTRSYSGLVQLNADGSVDESMLFPGVQNNVEALVRQPDGKILVAGGFWSQSSTPRKLARFHADGSLDVAFDPQVDDNTVACVELQPDGRIVIGGNFTRVGQTTRHRLARLNVDGSLDPSFDPATGPDDMVGCVRILPDGRLLVVGQFRSYAGVPAQHIARLHGDGRIDTGFAGGNGADSNLTDLLVLPDGRLLTGGYVRQYNGVNCAGVLRLNADGLLDPSYNLDTRGGNVYKFVRQTDGRLIIVGNFASINGANRLAIARVTADGGLDPSLNAVPVFPGQVRAMVNAPGGKVIIAGDFVTLNGAPCNRIARINADGSIDPTFDPGAGPSGDINWICSLPEGRLLLFGGIGMFDGVPCRGVVRIDADGHVDPSFQPAEGVWTPSSPPVVHPSGRILLATNQNTWGGTPVYGLLALKPDGTRDATFDIGSGVGQGSNSVRAIAVQGDGRILVGGQFGSFNGQNWNRVVRLMPSGVIDPTFHAGFESGWEVRSIVTMPDGKILLGGNIERYDGAACQGVVRLNPDGTRDTDYTPPHLGSAVSELLLQPDGRLLVTGWFWHVDNQIWTRNLARFNSDGTLDTSFGVYGQRNDVAVLALSDSGQLYGASSDSASTDGLIRFTAGEAALITAQPVSQTATSGEVVTFSVTASGFPAPTYQWMFNGAPIPEATAATFTISSAQPAHVGSYAVTVANAFGTITSNTVTLSGSGPQPVFTSQPQNVTAIAGQAATLTVGASGTALSYQWRRNGVPIAGATGTSYTIPTVSRSDSDCYDVIVYAGLVPAISQPARLDVAPTRYPNLLINDPAANLKMTRPWGEAWVVTLDSSGKFYLGGDFISVQGQPRCYLARFNADGSLDATFTSPIRNGRVEAVLPLAGGKLLVGGGFHDLGHAGRAYTGLVQLNADGSIDDAMQFPGLEGNVVALVRQSDGKILVGGGFGGRNGTPRNLARFHADGSLDTAFAPVFEGNSVLGVDVQSDGRILIGGDFDRVGNVTRNRVARLNPDGSLDTTFDPGAGPDDRVEGVRSDGEGRVIIVGSFRRFAGATAGRIARLLGTGALDPTFGTGGGGGNALFDVLVLPDGKLLVGGYSNEYGGVNRNSLARLNRDVSLDPTFATDSQGGSVRSIARQPDGRLLLAGGFTSIGGVVRQSLARLTADGVPEESVNAAPTFPAQARAILHAPGGKLIVAGNFTMLNGTAVNRLARLNADGSIDSTYNDGTGPNGDVDRICTLPDGGLLIFGGISSFDGVHRNGAVRLNADGSVDPTFNPSQWIGWTEGTPVVLPSGRIVVPTAESNWGGSPVYGLLALKPDGTRDMSFDVGGGVGQGGNSIRALAVQPDGKLLVGGLFSTFDGQACNRLVRLQPNGSIDRSFTLGNGVDGEVRRMEVLSDGKILVAGNINNYDGALAKGLIRLHADGRLDTDFRPPNLWNSVGVLLPQEDGRLLVGGWFSLTVGPRTFPNIVRLNADGSLDESFAIVGQVNAPGALALDDAGALAGGSLDIVNNDGLVRYVAGEAVQINLQPMSRTAAAGDSVTFEVGASGSGPLSYQWYLDGVPIPDAIMANLTVSNVHPADIGAYTVQVSNVFGAVLSATATLSGNGPAPVITIQPADFVSGVKGSSVTLTVGASGAGLSYQWRKYGVPIAGATTSSLTLNSIDDRYDGLYDVVVTGSDGLSVVTSHASRLTVGPAAYPIALKPRLDFAPKLEGPGEADVIAFLPDGGYYVAGSFTSVDGAARTGVARFLADGTLDQSFAPPILTNTTAAVRAIAVQSDGRVVLGGAFAYVDGELRPNLVRLNADGSVDPSFGAGSGIWGVNALALQADGQMIVAGYFQGVNGAPMKRLVRLDSVGARDLTFEAGTGFNGDVASLAIQADGKILVGGSFNSYNDSPCGRVVRINPDGSPDTAFLSNTGSGVAGSIAIMTIQSDGRILIGGNFTAFNGAPRRNLLRLNPDGTLDITFVPSGSAFDGAVRSVAAQADGRIIAVGQFTNYDGRVANHIARLTSTGAYDVTFNSGVGFEKYETDASFPLLVTAVAVRPTDGLIFAAGVFSSYNNALATVSCASTTMAVPMRLHPPSAPP